MHNEEKGRADIKALSHDGKCELSHVVRNAMMNILSAHCLKKDVARTIEHFEKQWASLGL